MLFRFLTLNDKIKLSEWKLLGGTWRPSERTLYLIHCLSDIHQLDRRLLFCELLIQTIMGGSDNRYLPPV